MICIVDFKFHSSYCLLYCQDYECSVICSVKTEAGVDEKLTHMQPVVLETTSLAQYVTNSSNIPHSFTNCCKLNSINFNFCTE